MKAFLLILALLWTLPGHAQEVDPRTAHIWWTAPTEKEDGTPITQPLTYRIYRVDGTFLVETSALEVWLPMQPLGLQCYVATAVTEGLESARTNPVCKLMRPHAPTDGSFVP